MRVDKQDVVLELFDILAGVCEVRDSKTNMPNMFKTSINQIHHICDLFGVKVSKKQIESYYDEAMSWQKEGLF